MVAESEQSHEKIDTVVYQATFSPTIAPVIIATASDILNSCGLITATRRPSRWMWTRSATSNTFGMLWLIRMTGSPRSRTRRMRSSTICVSLTPSAAVGSSMITTWRANAALHDFGLAPHAELIRDIQPKVETGRAATLDLLALTQPPDAILAGNNLLTAGALQAIRERGL